MLPNVKREWLRVCFFEDVFINDDEMFLVDINDKYFFKKST